MNQPTADAIGIHAILHTITVSVCIQYIRIVQDRIISHQELLFETGIQDAADSQDQKDTNLGTKSRKSDMPDPLKTVGSIHFCCFVESSASIPEIAAR